MMVKILEIIEFMLGAYKHSWPYLLVTIPLAVLVNISGLSKYIGKAFNSRPMVAIFLATIVGAFSPFCSCGVIPIISALLLGGVPLAPVMSFWLASPSMDPEVFFLSVSQLGMDLAIWRLAGTFFMSLSGGFITHFLIKLNWLEKEALKMKGSNVEKKIIFNPFTYFKSRIAPEPIISGNTLQGTSSGKVPEPMQFKVYTSEKNATSCSTGSCGSTCGSGQEAGGIGFFNRVLEESKKALFMIIKFMTLAFFLEALIVLYLPEGWITNILGKNNDFAITISAFIGIPLYTTNLTALGLMGGLLELGMNRGAVLAFLMGGATTTIPAMAAVYGLVKKKVFFLYVGFALSAALITGYSYQLISSL